MTGTEGGQAVIMPDEVPANSEILVPPALPRQAPHRRAGCTPGSSSFSLCDVIP